MREKNVWRWIRVAVARLIGAIGLTVYLYAAAGLIGGAIPANRGWRPAMRGVTVYLVSNGVHTDLVLPKATAGIDWRPLLRPEHLRDPRYGGYGFVAIGWGDAKFYRETPRWIDVRPATVLAAAVGSSATLIHVEHLPRPAPGPSVRALTMSESQYRRLAAFVAAAFAAPATHAFGYGNYDAFYPARGRYSAIRTCNGWTGDALRAAGVRVGRWTPFPATLLWWF